MTTLAAMLGAVPLVIATGPGSELRRPLGITIIGGLLVSQVLTLYTTPVIYLLLDRLHRRLGGMSIHLRQAAAGDAAEHSAGGVVQCCRPRESGDPVITDLSRPHGDERCVSASRTMGRPIRGDASLRDAPQDEAERSCGVLDRPLSRAMTTRVICAHRD